MYVTGALTAVLSTTDRLKDRFDFYYVIPSKSHIGNIIEKSGYKVYKIPFTEINKSPSLLLYIPKLFLNARRILKIMKRNRIDMLHVNDIFNMVGCVVKKMNPGIKLVNHVRLLKDSYISPLYPFFCKQLKKYADYIICVSKAVQKDVGDTAKSIVIYDVPVINEKYPIVHKNTDMSIKILYLGNYLPGKGQTFGLEAFKEFQKQFPNSSIKFVGASDTVQSAKFKQQLIESSAGYTNIEFASKTSDVEYEMKQHDVVLNLSLSESFSFVCLEAMLFGVPLIAADSGGPSEITDYGTKALLVPKNDAQAACNALVSFANDINFYRDRALASKKWAEQKFNSQSNINLMSKIYNIS